MLAQNIPQCHLHSRQCRHQHRAAAPVGIPVNVMEMLFNIQRILAHQIIADMLNRTVVAASSVIFVYGS